MAIKRIIYARNKPAVKPKPKATGGLIVGVDPAAGPDQSGVWFRQESNADYTPGSSPRDMVSYDININDIDPERSRQIAEELARAMRNAPLMAGNPEQRIVPRARVLSRLAAAETISQEEGIRRRVAAMTPAERLQEEGYYDDLIRRANTELLEQAQNDRATPARGMAYETTLNNARTDDWLTPLPLINALGRFDLDPCCPENMPWRTARIMYTQRNDGLVAPWGRHRVWLNPPYGKATGVWLKKLRDHGNGVALVFARTETRMFQESVWDHAHGIVFISGRLKFHRPDGTQGQAATAPSVLIAYGRSNAEALQHATTCNPFAIKGKYIRLKT